MTKIRSLGQDNDYAYLVTFGWNGARAYTDLETAKAEAKAAIKNGCPCASIWKNVEDFEAID